ncbi:VOC family protein [Mucisphaera sp.]|uniref:VOC family protein n=1 Tax=Mucisphaera sp. TaxID=2913024 RepID=UPI003D104273
MKHFSFQAAFKSDWYVHLVHAERPTCCLAVLHAEHETIPASYGAEARGVLVNFEIDDASSAFEQAKRDGLEIVQPLRDEVFGQRHFIVQAPGGVLVDVIEEIEPMEPFRSMFVDGTDAKGASPEHGVRP